MTNYDHKKLLIKSKISNKTSLLSGPYTSINLMKNDYIQLNNFGFEELTLSSMSKLIIFLIICVFKFNFLLAAEPMVQARTAIVVDYHSDKVLYEYDADAQIYPASNDENNDYNCCIRFIK